MNMTMKNLQRLALVILLLVVVVFGLNTVRSKYQSFKAQQTEDQKIQEIKDITQVLLNIAITTGALMNITEGRSVGTLRLQ